jgi:phytoene synthase
MAALLAGQPAETGLDGALSRMVEEFTTAALPCDADMHHAIHVLQACRQDVAKSRYRDWNELLLYCRYAAAPLGRFCLEALGEDTAAQAPAEALCCALALLMVLRDCGRDYRQRGQVYLPERWLSEAGCSVSALAAERSDERLRQVLAQGLDAADRLLVTARLLPRLIRDRRLRGASAAALTVAEKLAQRLRKGDPLADAIVLTRGDRRAALWRGRWRRIWR